jgi:hypothetical protein
MTSKIIDVLKEADERTFFTAAHGLICALAKEPRSSLTMDYRSRILTVNAIALIERLESLPISELPSRQRNRYLVLLDRMMSERIRSRNIHVDPKHIDQLRAISPQY